MWSLMPTILVAIAVILFLVAIFYAYYLKNKNNTSSGGTGSGSGSTNTKAAITVDDATQKKISGLTIGGTVAAVIGLALQVVSYSKVRQLGAGC